MITDRVREHICNLDDAALAEYVRVGTNEYEEHAVAFAQGELARRGFSAEQLDVLNQSARDRHEAEEALTAIIANEPLNPPGRILAFIGGCHGFPWFSYLFFYARFTSRGELRKAHDLRNFGLLGLAATLIAIAVIATFAQGS